ncbi:MAG: YidC/Oxa1 family membrane protein insertase [Candidatus Nomurabacteria bacterium]|jgi:YidC/Oxa1 family membrane protein insertase|nr:YidC/Oxa1 family membrane protein insertase [Candidatus Nomurabacteria bacterium]
MNIFDRLLTQPIFNVLALIYNFVMDFGVAIIILTILIRFILWPLVKKQLHQTKLMRSIQPELKKIKKQAKGNRMLESQMMMEIYREKNIKPFGSILVLLVQLPIFFAIFRVIQIFSTTYQQAQHVMPSDFVYPFLENFGRIPELLANSSTHLFGIIDLTKTAGSYMPALIITALAAACQFYQSKQIMPQASEKKKLRDMFKEAAAGKEVDQTEMAAATTGKMIYLFPVMTFMIGLMLPAAVMLYYATTSLVAVIQQHVLLKKDLGEMQELVSDENKSGPSREKKAREAEIIVRKPSKNKKSDQIRSSGGQTVVRRIKAK